MISNIKIRNFESYVVIGYKAEHLEKRNFCSRQEGSWGQSKKTDNFLVILWSFTSHHEKRTLAMCYQKDLLLFCLLDNVIDHRWEIVYSNFMPTARMNQLPLKYNDLIFGDKS